LKKGKERKARKNKRKFVQGRKGESRKIKEK
jgi:hypothetical protein